MKRIISILLVFTVLLGMFALDFSALAASKKVTIKVNVSEDYSTAAQVATLLNSARSKSGRAKIKYNSALTDFAMQRAAEISVLYNGAHKRPNGTLPTSVKKIDGENIAYGQLSAKDVMAHWMSSAAHKKNIMNKSFKSFGIGCVKVQGVYFWVQIFSKSAYGSSYKKGVVNSTRNIVIPENKLFLYASAVGDNSKHYEDEYYDWSTGDYLVNYADFADGYQIVVRAVHIDDQSGGETGFPVVSKDTLSYKSSDSSVLSINSKGLATIKKTGAVKVTAQLKSSVKKAVQKYNLTKNLDISLNKTSFVYNADNQLPEVKVYYADGTQMENDMYSVSYPDSSVNVGKYYITVDYEFSAIKKAFSVLPKGTEPTKLTAGKKSFNVKWKKQALQTTGYQIQYSLNSNFSGAKAVTVNNTKTVSKTISGLNAKKNYYVRIRTYKTLGGANYFSAWSKAFKIKTK